MIFFFEILLNRFQQDLDFTFYDNILREIISSPAGPPEAVWIVGEFDEDDALVNRLQVEHKNIRKAVSS